MGSTVAIIPVKMLTEAKSRLGNRLAPDERVALVVGLLRSVLGVLAEAGITHRLVVSPDTTVLNLARQAGAIGLQQVDRGLNPGLEAARLASPTTDLLLVVPADLPLLRPAEVCQALALAADRQTALVAPDRAQRGTNLLILPADAHLPFAFGPDSYRQHQRVAEAAGLKVYRFQSPGTRHDLDTAADLEALGRRGWPFFGGLLAETWPVPSSLGGCA